MLGLASSRELRSGTRFFGPDAYMRLVRVQRLAETGDWFDSSVPRSNWPDGEVLHWSRPMDVAVLSIATVLTPVLGFEGALRQAGVWVAPLLLAATFVVVVWAGTPLVSAAGTGFLGLALLVQPILLSYGLPGRPDHHALILLCFAAALGFALRAFTPPGKVAWARALGLSAGIGLWVSPEFLLPLGIFLAGGVICWILRPHGLIDLNRQWTRALLLTVLAGLIAERGPGLLTVEYDRLSLAHGVVAAIAAVFWGVLAGLGESATRWTPSRRAMVAAGVGLPALGLMALLFPPFFRGPMAGVEDPLVLDWLGRVAELQPALFPSGADGLGFLLVCAGSALVGLPYLVATVRRREEPLAPRVLLLVGLVVCLGLSLAQLRWVTYAEVLSVPVLGEMLIRVRRRISEADAPPLRRAVARAVASAGLIAAPLIAGSALLARPGRSPEGVPSGPGGCDPEGIAGLLGGPDWSARPRTIAAYMDPGPALLYRTRHRVIATPYHRHAQGMRKGHEPMSATDSASARVRAEEWEVDLILLCPGADGVLYPETVGGAPTLYGHLLGGEPPDWLVPVPVGELDGVLLFQVTDS